MSIGQGALPIGTAYQYPKCEVHPFDGCSLTIPDSPSILDVILVCAEVAEQADAHDSKSCGVTRVGAIPTFGTKSVSWMNDIQLRIGIIAGLSIFQETTPVVYAQTYPYASLQPKETVRRKSDGQRSSTKRKVSLHWIE